jgi:hypothetical protein
VTIHLQLLIKSSRGWVVQEMRTVQIQEIILGSREVHRGERATGTARERDRRDREVNSECYQEGGRPMNNVKLLLIEWFKFCLESEVGKEGPVKEVRRRVTTIAHDRKMFKHVWTLIVVPQRTASG